MTKADRIIAIALMVIGLVMALWACVHFGICKMEIPGVDDKSQSSYQKQTQDTASKAFGSTLGGDTG